MVTALVLLGGVLACVLGGYFMIWMINKVDITIPGRSGRD